jgi:hypothetical protein
MLSSEGGNNILEKHFEHLKIFRSDLERPDCVHNINFRLRCVLPFSSLDIEYLDPKSENNMFSW